MDKHVAKSLDRWLTQTPEEYYGTEEDEVEDQEELVVTASLHINGPHARSTHFSCGGTDVWIGKSGKVYGLGVNGIKGGHVGYQELEAIIEGIIEWAKDRK